LETNDWFQFDRTIFDKEAEQQSEFDQKLDPNYSGPKSEPTIYVSSSEQEIEVRKEFSESSLSKEDMPRIVLIESEIENWQRAKSLRHLFQTDFFQLNTPLWHALNILYWYHDKFLTDWDELVNHGEWNTLTREGAGVSLLLVANYALEVGRSFEALKNKKYESAAITGLKIKSGQRIAASMTDALHRPQRVRRLKRMAELVPRFGVEAASRVCSHEGLGSPQSIKRQYNRWKKRRDI